MSITPEPSRTAGALVISLDFELNWGVRDSKNRNGSYNRNLLGARDAIPAMLKLFQRYGISATWATVGLLFARSRDESEHYWPAMRPCYSDPRVDPYRQDIGKDEGSDPLHFGASLLDAICATPRQEVGSQ